MNSSIYVAKIEGKNVKVYDAEKGSLKRVIPCVAYRGANNLVISGDLISIGCGDGRLRVFDIKTGSLKRVF